MAKKRRRLLCLISLTILGISKGTFTQSSAWLEIPDQAGALNCPRAVLCRPWNKPQIQKSRTDGVLCPCRGPSSDPGWCGRADRILPPQQVCGALAEEPSLILPSVANTPPVA